MANPTSSFAKLFAAEAKKDHKRINHANTSLRPIFAILNTVQPAPPRGAYLQPPNASRVRDAINALPAAKKTRYATSLNWLSNYLPVPLKVSLTGAPPQATPAMLRKKDSSGKSYEIYNQEKQNSCGPACLYMVLKELTHLRRMTEAELQDLAGLHQQGLANTGATSSSHNWESQGSVLTSLVPVLTTNGVKAKAHKGSADAVDNALKQCTNNYRGIVGWYWTSSATTNEKRGGHWTVCAGLTPDKSKLIILDPWYSDVVQYVDINAKDANGYLRYTPVDNSGSTKSYGWCDWSFDAVLTTNPS
ncbi:cysteine peptidase family C39 domain-containing protein [Thiorhodococcus minor]|uniref:Peptidase C39-like domain-containing protein n=1 Tax=Thiorhodococcus minor TaxID=57489 RepID=A0A6M0JVK1_9GAMM|nr:cysteine peptidase family C39 domain-containing protein [Thiorhodococcus minor]NEV60941.1 hypothetical protein [Thiorhodococcus minor]